MIPGNHDGPGYPIERAPRGAPGRKAIVNSDETRTERMTRVAEELGTALRRQARGRWKKVRTAQRNERNRRVWRFRFPAGGGERFLYIRHQAMLEGGDPAGRLLDQLEAEHWLDRLRQGPAAALVLTKEGRLEAVREN